ncbi:Ctr copper transporter family-domain-containing protein [Hypoxylon trugodes]|uniref:Ctr copper transporter family-domain-containing protein n=1 Tax=Hypoxylon trugodes TaxID=326681 RepID=UPI002198F676|nr:Ctr copper transporter family-domain-containing protein [Hypoxylon trugodes]KAI1394291.1 Ctr copper transporter family-domain-containing protein [Hypoxylon trugodes]
MDMSSMSGMDMSSMSMSMTMDMSSTATVTGAAPTSTGMSMDMGGMSMGGDSCKISMLWNWYTIDSCFLASSWHNTSSGMFAGSCIGVILLTMTLELLRRTVREYDRYLIRKHTSTFVLAPAATSSTSDDKTATARPTSLQQNAVQSGGFRPTILEQAIRALLHMVQFAVAYFIMLLAMYYNGYIIICIFIGAYLGAFVFHWEHLDTGRRATSATQEPTVCCA